MPRDARKVVTYRYRTLARDLGPVLWSGEGRTEWMYNTAQCVGRLVGSIENRVTVL
jgi:hypothetical protein